MTLRQLNTNDKCGNSMTMTLRNFKANDNTAATQCSLRNCVSLSPSLSLCPSVLHSLSLSYCRSVLLSLCLSLQLTGALWSGSTKNRHISTGTLARPFACSLVPLTRSFAPNCSLRSRPLLRSLIRSLAHYTHSLARGKVNF